MTILRHTSAHIQLAVLSLVYASTVFAADPEAPQRYDWPWWHESHGHSFWWIFPLTFFVMIIVMFVLMRRGGMGCMWGHRMMDRPEYRDVMKRYWGEPSETAMDILDKRYASGEIDKEEYEEKKSGNYSSRLEDAEQLKSYRSRSVHFTRDY